MIKIFLELIGFIKYNKKLSNNDHKGFRYAEFHGDIDPKERYEAVNAMNDKDNIYGDIVKIIFITSAGAEGISLKNIRQCHIMEPHWNESRIIQVIGRGNRLCSHRMLPINERILDVYRYKSIHPNKQSTDEYIEKTAQYKEEINKSFLNAIKEAAERTGAKKVFLEEEPKVASIGAGMDISKPSGNMVIDIGGGTTDIAILSLGGIVNSASIRIAGNAFDNDIVKYIKDKYKL